MLSFFSLVVVPIIFSLITIASLYKVCNAQNYPSRQLQEIRDFYQSLMTYNTDGIVLIDPNGHVIDANPRVAELTGYSLAEIRNQPLKNLVVPEDHSPAWKLYQSALTGEPQESEFAILCADGTRCDLSVKIVPIAREDGTIVGVHIIGKDITPRKKAEAEIQNRARQQKAVATLGIQALSSSDLDAILEKAAALVGEILEVETAAILEYLPNEGEMAIRFCWPSDCPLDTHRKFSAEACRSQAGMTLRKNAPVVVASKQEAGFSTDHWEQHGFTSAATVLIQGQDGPFGVLGAYSANRRHFSPDDIFFLQSLANVVSSAVERKQFENRLLQLAHRDPLTNLFNRRRFHEELSNQLAQASRYEAQGALLYLDLDNFKDVNDSFGHSTGDELLKSLAEVLRNRLRSSDILARLGGDEFAVILPYADRAQAESLAAQLLTEMSQHAIHLNKQCTISVTTSIGIALFPHQGKTAEELLAKADRAMYQAKDLGRNRFATFSDDLQSLGKRPKCS